MKVKKAMHEGFWMDRDASLIEVAWAMWKHNVGAIPIGESDRLIGMVTERDIVCRGLAQGLDLSTATAGDVMTKGIVYINESADLRDAAETMERMNVLRLAVLSDSKRMTGILSVNDLSHAGERELVGEIIDVVRKARPK